MQVLQASAAGHEFGWTCAPDGLGAMRVRPRLSQPLSDGAHAVAAVVAAGPAGSRGWGRFFSAASRRILKSGRAALKSGSRALPVAALAPGRSMCCLIVTQEHTAVLQRWSTAEAANEIESGVSGASVSRHARYASVSRHARPAQPFGRSRGRHGYRGAIAKPLQASHARWLRLRAVCMSIMAMAMHNAAF